MKNNVGGFDKVFRIVLGLIIIAAGVFYKNWWGAVGILPLLTGVFGTCFLYSLLGISTAKKGGAKKAAKKKKAVKKKKK